MKKFITYLLVAVIFQAGIYLYLDQVVLVPAASFSQQIITEGNKQTVIDKFSSDQKYFAKFQTNSVSFVTADNKVIKDVPLHINDSANFLSWVPNTHLALIGISNNTSRATSVTLKSINLDTNSLPQEPKISGLSRGAKITNVAYSPQVNVAYILVSVSNSSSIYRTDANNKLTKVFSSSSVARIACLQSVDMLLYDNKHDGSVYARGTNGKKRMVSPKVGKYALIGSDKNDNIYISRLNSKGEVSAVLKGNINGNFKEFQALNSPVPVTSVTISYDGDLNFN